MRSVVFRFESVDQLAQQLELSGDDQDLDLPPGERFREGEWVLAHFCVGEESTAVAACIADRGAGVRLAFEERDWEHLPDFTQDDGDSRASLPPPSVPANRISPMWKNVPPNTRVLLVDDDQDLQRVVGALLVHAGYETKTASSAEQALAVLRTEQFDLMVLDWNLPGMTGLQLCTRLREIGSRLPILFLTAHSASEDIVAAFDAGADDFVPKPFRAPELTARVMGLLRRSQIPILL
ncbi:MAG: response regulator [Polyangiaceae bacterium]